MRVPGRIAVVAAGLLAYAAAPAHAVDYCVQFGFEGCIELPTLADALTAANATADRDRIFLGELSEQAGSGPFADQAGRPVSIVGLGPATSKLKAAEGLTSTVRLSDPGSSLARVAITAPGGSSGVAAELLAGAELTDATLVGGLAALPGSASSASARALRLGIVTAGRPGLQASAVDLVAESVDMGVNGDVAALRVTCSIDADGSLVARHLSLSGSMRLAGVTDCDGTRRADLTIENSVLPLSYSGASGPFERAGTAGTPTGNGAITTAWSVHPDDPGDATASDRLAGVADPGYTSASDHRLRAGSPLVDAGDPAPLTPRTLSQSGEGLTDAAGLARITDGSDDGVVRRDVGAHELQPQPVAIPADNVLANPGAEVATDPLSGWSSTGSFRGAGFGSDEFFPGRPIAAALAAGERFFAGGTASDSTLMQRIDVANSAGSIDSGGASATLAGLLGGYGADADEVLLGALFRDPAGEVISSLSVPGPTPAERGNATNLLARSATGPIPARTRAIDVVLTAHRVAGSYTDGYADNLSLTLSVPGVPVQGPVDTGKPVVGGLKPFAGVTVLTGRPPLSLRGAVRVGLGCESATVGRCSGTIELRAIPAGRKTPVRIARFGSFSMRPGQTQTVIVKLLLARRSAFLGHRSFRATLAVVARDGQGLERRKMVPVRVVRAVARKR